MPLTIAVILALAAGLIAGAIAAAVGGPGAIQALAALQPIGELWLSALQMTVLPLLVALLITSMASASDTAANGRLAGRTLLTFVILLSAAGLASAIVTPAMIALWPVDAEAAATLRAGLQGVEAAVPAPPPMSEWFRHIIPANPFRAASEGSTLQLVIFALIFGLAAARLKPELRAPLLGFFEAVTQTMLVIVKWVLWAAPAGVFVLATAVGLQGGAAAAGAIAQYIVMMSIIGVLIALASYAVAVAFGRVSLAQFARAAAPAQAVGFSTQSSLASLPAMLTGAEQGLGISPRVAGLVLPLAVSLFRMTSPPVNLGIVLFVAHVYGVEIGFEQLAAGVLVCIITSFAVVSLPSAITFFTTTVPISFAMGVPVELLTLLVAVEVFPDLFRTVGNVTADLAATTVVARGERHSTLESEQRTANGGQ